VGDETAHSNISEQRHRADLDAIKWEDYPRIPQGHYRAYCKYGKHYRDPGFKRWTCLLRWDVLTDDLLRVLACVPMWFHLGDGRKPRASRRGKYFPEWIRANGAPPVRKDRLPPSVFVYRMARVKIGDTKGPAPYSVVREIIEWETGLRGHSVNKSHSQGWHGQSAAVSEAYGDRLSDYEASARAGVEGETTPTHTQGAGVSTLDSPVKGNLPHCTVVSLTAAHSEAVETIHLERGCCPYVAR
jgi:hypothetical protein